MDAAVSTCCCSGSGLWAIGTNTKRLHALLTLCQPPVPVLAPPKLCLRQGPRRRHELPCTVVSMVASSPKLRGWLR
eukprot:9902707-Ditylum_brightwellii.AAC.1